MNIEPKYLYAIIRKPQEGKTFICLKNICINNNNIHIIVTMNSIKSNKQFFERAYQQFGNKICILNSDNKNKEYNQADNINNIINYIKKENCNIIICCANAKRLRESIYDLIEYIDDSKSINKFISIHIDEAHEYVRRYSDSITKFNEHELVDRIYMYSASPFKMWVPEDSKTNDIFKRIYVIDIAEQFQIMKTDKYFGVKDCEHKIIDCSNVKLINEEIPKYLIEEYIEKDIEKEKFLLKNKYYSDHFPFSLGNEIKFLSYTKYILEKMKDNEIKNNKFSYNFVPAYVRKITHYAIMDIILSLYDNAIVIIINGDGSRIFYIGDNNCRKKKIMIDENESAKQIQKYIKKYPNRPFFITGFHCIGMSVTFINEITGNFDNVIFNHEHYHNQPEILYQLCRFLFNYITWKNTDNIKKTKLFTNSQKTLQICLDYEKQIDKIECELSGNVLTQDEVMGDFKTNKRIVPNEKRYQALNRHSKCEIKTFIVENGKDDKVYNKVMKYCAKFKFSGNIKKTVNDKGEQRYVCSLTGKKLSEKSIPKKNANNFYECSLTQNKGVQHNPSEIKRTLKRWEPTAAFQITKNTYKYFRIFVAYNDLEDSTDYIWFVRTLKLEENDDVKKLLNNSTNNVKKPLNKSNNNVKNPLNKPNVKKTLNKSNNNIKKQSNKPIVKKIIIKKIYNY